MASSNKTKETEVTTITTVEDRTEAPVEVAAVEYHSTDVENIDGKGTVLTTYGEPVGGFVVADEADAA